MDRRSSRATREIFPVEICNMTSHYIVENVVNVMKGNTRKRDGMHARTGCEAMRGERELRICIPRSRYHRNVGNISAGALRFNATRCIQKHPRFEERNRLTSIYSEDPTRSREKETGRICLSNQALILYKSLITPAFP